MAKVARAFWMLLLPGLLAAAGCGKPGGPAETGGATAPSPSRWAVTTADVVYSVADNWDDVEKLYQFYGKGVEKCVEGCPSPVPKLYPEGLSAEARDPLISAHPAYSAKGEVGETILRFPVALPEEPTYLLFGAFLSRAPGPSDGAEFVVKVGDETVFSEVINSSSAQRREVDLRAYAGKTVTIKLITGPGPRKNVSADWALWLDPRIVR
ncbi:MAG: hypothetical protein JSV79_01715 [Armatimonadota bacterium]|nr:MAG: hypothetical protein JSV79_01715 [Armatimonadota bacterium]